jgi:hypothetical protein
MATPSGESGHDLAHASAMKDLRQRLRSSPIREVSVGFGGVEIFAATKLVTEQVGYSVSPAGEDLCGQGRWDWRKSWVVIGRETLCGDPVFVDTADASLPVYTAMHGMGEWKPDRICDSFTALAATLEEVAKRAKGRADSDLEERPLSSAEQRQLIKRLKTISPDSAPDFWIDLFAVE